MFKNTIMYFNDKIEASEVIELIVKYDNAVKVQDKDQMYGLEGKLIKIMKSRVQSRYLTVVKECIKKDDDNWGFMIMSINCILIELYYQLENGLNKTNDKKGTIIKNAFEQVVPKLDKDFTTEIGGQFYLDIRCKLIHQAQTNSNVALSLETPEMIYPFEKENYTVYNPKLFFNKINDLYVDLFDRSLNENDVSLKENIIEKVRYIAYKK